MRHSRPGFRVLLTLLGPLAVSGCAAALATLCRDGPGNGPIQLSDPPPNAAQLRDMAARKTPPNPREFWIRDDASLISLCRLPRDCRIDSCDAAVDSFRNSADGWRLIDSYEVLTWHER